MGEGFVGEDAGGGSDAARALIGRVMALIRESGLAPGDRIPSERQIAERLGANRNAVHQALSTLAVMGVVEMSHGTRTRLCRTGDALLGLPFEFLMLLDRPPFHKLHQARESLEVYLAGLAATERTGADLHEIEAAVREVGAGRKGANARFHTAVAQAAHNPVLARVLRALLNEHDRFITERFPEDGGWVICNEIHERVLEAIRQQDPGEARRWMTQDMQMGLRYWQHLTHGEEVAAPAAAPVSAPGGGDGR